MSLRYLTNVTTLRLDAGRCIGCGRCLEVCPHAVFTMGSAGRVAITDCDACIECGACARNCPVSALTVKSGVGCAAGIIAGALRGKNACCSDDSCCVS